MTYPWAYLEHGAARGKILFDAIQPFLKRGDAFLDLACGYSPLARLILDAGYSLCGFDINPVPIQHLKKTLPKGRWLVAGDKDIDTVGYSVFLLLGITTPLQPVYSTTLLLSFMRLLQANKPRLVLAEGASRIDQTFYEKTMKLLGDAAEYMQEVSVQYDAHLTQASKRHYSIWSRKTHG